jgi:hypothetical protein
MINYYVEIGILLLTIIAIVYGPIKAVKITRDSDARREKRARQYAILSDLMKTRQARIDPLHVAAINLIELEFYECKAVTSAFKDYATHLNSHFPQAPEALDRHMDHGDALFSELLRRIADELDFKFDKDDLKRLAYLPIGISRHHDNSVMNASLLREVLEGKRPLQISNIISNDGIFPPTPKKKLLTDQSESKSDDS